MLTQRRGVQLNHIIYRIRFAGHNNRWEVTVNKAVACYMRSKTALTHEVQGWAKTRRRRGHYSEVYIYDREGELQKHTTYEPTKWSR